jgi:predicted aspartyl protease
VLRRPGVRIRVAAAALRTAGGEGVAQDLLGGVADEDERQVPARLLGDVLDVALVRSPYYGRSMELFGVQARLTGPTGRVEPVELRVDTGATLLTVPRELATRLGLTAPRSQPVVIAGGGRDVWPVAEVRLALDGQEVTTPCFIAPSGPALLGAVALESLFSAVHPVAKRLVPVEGFAG